MNSSNPDEQYHPGVLAKLIYDKLLLEQGLPDIYENGEEIIIYMGLRCVKRKNIYSVKMYIEKTSVILDNEYLLKLIFEHLC